MKHKLLGILGAVALVFGATSAPAANVSVSVFYDSLEPYGEWFETPDYGYVWHPRNVDDNWRPYTEGNWAYTDSGWTWVSEEPFGWATYHYGRWIEIDRVGWTWIPDREWGPAWVSWRRSEQHVGWAPLPPEARFEARVGFHEWTDSYYDIGPTYYSFVNVRDFGAPRLRSVIIEPRQNLTIIRETRNITNITYVNNVVFNEGPRYDAISRETAQPIRRLKLERRNDLDYRAGGDRNRFTAQVQGDVLRIAAPDIAVSHEDRPGKLGKKLDRVDVDRGWKRAGDAQSVEQFRTRVTAETKAPAELPVAPKLVGSDHPTRANRPAGATVETTAPDATAPGRERERKPGMNKPAVAAETPPANDPAKPGTTAETTAPPVKDAIREGKGKGKGRTPAVAETVPTPDAEKPAKGAVRDRAPKETPAITRTPEPDATRPNANAERERMPNRPEARENAEPPATRPEGEKMKKRAPVAPEAIEPDRAPRERPNADRPNAERPARPDAAPDRPARPERVAPPAAPEEREPKRKGPPATEDRNPDRARPEAADRAPENRPDAPEAAKKRGGKPEKPADDGTPDDKKKKD